jgi:diacylglycerol O-acyltransferase / wax synthase
MANVMASAAQALRGQLKSAPQLLAAFGKIFRRVGEGGDGMVVPFDAPLSVLNGRVREKRRFATQQFPMARLRALADAAGCTLNDVVLALCGGSLRRFLLERDSLPDKSLTAGIPVSVRPKDDQGTGNAISFIVATLGTDIEDAAERLAAIRASVRHAKAHVQSLPRQAMMQYTVLLMAPTIVTLLSGIGGRTRPMFNITISNVPGPEKPLYFRGARLRGHLSGVDRHARPGAEHHLPELRRHDGLRLHRLPFVGAQPAEAGGVFRRGAGGTGSGDAAEAGAQDIGSQAQGAGQAQAQRRPGLSAGTFSPA